MSDLLNTPASYGDDAIVTLTPREHIRLRPGMYVGVVGDGSQPDEALYVLIKEVVDNSIDEFIMGAGRQIDITLADNVVTVRRCLLRFLRQRNWDMKFPHFRSFRICFIRDFYWSAL